LALPGACHLAIADRWDIWYLNAGMSLSAGKRLEEEAFMRTFDIGFARRHRTALVFPYKAPQMRKVFDAFAAMLYRRGWHVREKAA
jgi:hypothetical protein